MKEFRLPPMSATMTEATIVRWLKDMGQEVSVGETLLEVESDKAAIEIESPFSGTLQKIYYGEGQAVPSGAVIATIGVANEGDETHDTSLRGRSNEVLLNSVPAADLEGDEIRSSPAARRLARKYGMDIDLIRGTGPHGRITTEDIERANREGTGGEVAKEPIPSLDKKVPSALRRRIAYTVTQSHAEIPSFWVGELANLQDLTRFMVVVNAGFDNNDSRITLTDFILQTISEILVDFPEISQRIVSENDQFIVETLPSTNIGLVVAIPGGVIVPVVTDLAGQGLLRIAKKRRDIVSAVRGGQIPHHTLANAAISISNVGNIGVERFAAMVQPGQSAIIAVGSLQDYVVAQDREVCVVKGCYLTLTVDHRLIDGLMAAQFLHNIIGRLESGPWKLL